MKLNNLSRLTALLLALTIFMTSVAFADPVAVSDYTADDYASQLQAAYIAAYAYDGTADVGKYAKFAESEDFIFVYDNDPNLSDDAYSFAYEEFLEDTIVRITDWAWMSSTSALLYKVEFYRGGVIEEAAEYWPAEAWVLQCYTDSNEFASLEFVTICEDCGEPDCNINHNPPDTEAVIPETPTLTEGEDVSLVDANGEPITDGEILRIKEGTKYSLSAWTGLEDKGDETYQWQISAEETGGVWVNISGQTSKGLLTSLAMFEAAFKTVPYIRCKITTGGQTLYSQAIPVAALAEATLTDSNSDVSVAGLLPLDATLNVTSTSLEETGLNNGAYPVGEASLFSDVTLYRAGSTYQPEEDETVTVTFPEASVTEAGLSAGDGYHIYHIHDGAVDISGIQQYNGGDIAMTFGSLSVVGISEATQAEQSLVAEHGEMTPGYFDSYKVGTFNSDSVVLYNTPNEAEYVRMTTITGYSGAEVTFDTYYTYVDGFVVYKIEATNNTPEELVTTMDLEYCFVSAADITISGETEGPEVINTCAICGTENCTKQHLYCEEHSKFDCTENHEKAEPTKPLTEAAIPENLTFTPDADVCIADAKGNKVTSSFELPAGTQASLSAWPAGDAYQWQIKDQDGNWMDIRGKDQRGLLFSGALFADANAQPVIRCEVTVGGEVKHSAEIRVNVTTPAAEASLLSVARAADPVVTAEGDNLREYTVVINYVFAETNEVVANPYTATLAAGSNWSATVKNPTVMGYLPYVTETETAESVEVNITNIQADVTYTVTYKPTNVNYTVIHYWQNVDNDNFTEHERETLQGLTGSTVPEVANTYPGMYALLYEKPAIAADGSTVVEVYYDRNYYLMLFELDGGYGVEPIYARYGAAVGTIADPTRMGYNFDYWSPAIPATVPVNGGTYTAIWIAGDTTYNVLYWQENANDSGYSFFETEKIGATAGSVVSGSDTKTYEGFHFDHADTNVTVAGDGSTNVNVYYKRNTYTLTFAYEGGPLICKQESHSHSNSCCKYGGTSLFHWSHSDDCCSLGLHTHSVANGCYGIQFTGIKYGQATDSYWAQAPALKWKVTYSGTTFYTNAPAMPNSNLTIYGASQSGTSVIHYYEYVDGQKTTTSVRPDYTVNTEGWSFTQEDYIAIPGFEYHSHEQVSDSDYRIYYTRKSYSITFNNGKESTEKGPYLYEADISGTYFVPTYTGDNPDTYTFGGWYTTEECLDGTEFVFTGAKMPYNNLLLYAKWVPVNHTVSFYLDYDESVAENGTKLYDDVTVPHGSYVTPVPATPTNGAYTFVGWFYMDGDVEKAFDFANMPITKDLQVYGKWSSNVLKEYIVYFRYKEADGTVVDIADPITGSTLAGETKTFDAKGDEELYPDYQEGYFPLVESHSMTLDIDTPTSVVEGWTEITNEDGSKEIIQSFTFWYVQKNAVPYTVYYVAETLKEGESTEGKETITRGGKTYYIIADTKTDPNNRKAVVTEQFKAVTGYMPDAYQKRLVVIDGADNEIIFYYKVDTEHAYYKITHLTQNTDGENWTEYKSSQAPGDIGKTVLNADSFDEHIDGFTFKIELTEACVGNETTVVGGNNVTLTAAGLELKLYYTRNKYPYEVRYLEEGTGNKLAEPKKGSGLFGEVKSESAIDIRDYTAVDPTSQTLTIKIEESQTEAKLNIITFYYTEDEVKINYVPVGPNDATNFGSVTPDAETVKVLSGTAQGSTATATEYYTFVGWYSDEACTEANKLTTETKYVPAQVDGKNVEATYYAKFVEKTATINYVAVGPQGATDFGSVAPEYETVDVLTGVAQGSTATAGTGYKFVGWYKDAACTQPVDESWISDSSITGGTIDPQKNTNGVYEAATYYAKFDWHVGQLAITKTVIYPDGYSFPDDVFTFTVTLGTEGTFPYVVTNGETKVSEGKVATGGTITLKAGETATISNLVHDTTYTVTEDADKMPAGYFFKKATNADNGKIVAGTPVTASFTNEYKVGSLTISKEVVGDEGVVPGDAFEFTLDLSNKQSSYSYTKKNAAGTTLESNQSVAPTGAVTMFDGESITITGIPLGTDFTVTETENSNYTQSPDKVQGKIGTDSKAEFTNTYLLGDLQITKRVANDTGFTPMVSEFVIQVELTGTNLNPAGYTVEGLATDKPVNWDGSATKLTAQIPVTAIDGNSATVTIKHLPAGTEYTVTENAPVGFTDSIETTADNTNTTNKIDAGKMDAVTVTNTYKVGSLKVAKTVVGEVTEAYPSVFNFTLELSDDVPVEKCKIQIANGAQSQMDANGQFTLVAGQTALITGIPDGVTYTVTESSDNITDYFTTTVAVNSGTATTAYVGSGTMNAATDTADAPATVAFVNTAKTSDLTIEKSGMSSTNESAIVNVTVGDDNYTVVLNSDNKWKAVIAGLPIGATYFATETSWTWRYTGTVSGGGTISETKDTSKITVTNNPNGDKWLHDESVKHNVFGTTTTTTEGGEQ